MAEEMEKAVPVFGIAHDLIRPSAILSIDKKGAVPSSFGKFEVEKTAGRLVQFMAFGIDNWRLFKLKELMDYYTIMGWDPGECLDGMMAWIDLERAYTGVYEPEPLIVSMLDGYFAVTRNFILRCAGKLNNKTPAS